MPAPTEATAIPAALEFSNWAGGGILLNMPTILNFSSMLGDRASFKKSKVLGGIHEVVSFALIYFNR